MKKYLFISLLFFGCQSEDTDQIEAALELPKIVIETEGFKEIDSKDDYIDGSFKFFANDYGFDDFEKPIRIRGRGNSTWNMPKKSYQFKFDEKFSLFNLPEDKFIFCCFNLFFGEII